jgi:hypothetical protein
VSEAILDVIAKDEQVQHVAGDVQHAAMQKHACDQRRPGDAERRAWRDLDAAGVFDRHDTRGGEEPIEIGAAANEQLVQKDEHIEQQDRDHDPREAAPGAGVVLEGDHGLCPPQAIDTRDPPYT